MITEIENFDIKHNNTFNLSAMTDVWIEYTSAEEIPSIMDQASGGEWLCIGSGSNMLFTRDYHGTILHSRILDAETTTGDDSTLLLRAGSGIEMDSLIEQSCANGLWGLENLSGIPGTVGASAVQNVGAYGVEAKDIIHSIECYDIETKKFVTLVPQDCDYGYRHSMFKTAEGKKKYIVTYVTYRLTTIPSPRLQYGNLAAHIGKNPTPQEIRNAVIEMRNSKLPSVDIIGSAGSFFKNPVTDSTTFKALESRATALFGDETQVPHYKTGNEIKVPAAWLIDKCDMKGKTNGGAAVWVKQPLVIVNATGRATANDIIELEKEIIEKVKNTFGIILSPEVEHI